MKRVNVFGGTLVDLNFGLPKQFIHRYQQAAKIELPFGEKLTTDGYQITPGGSGANVAVGLVKAGYRVWFHTTIAEDVFGDFLRRSLKDLTIDLDEATGTTATPLSVILRIGGERTIITGRSSATSIARDIPETGWLHLGPLHGELDDGLTRLLAHQVKSGQELSLNPSMDMIQERSRPFLSLLKVSNILFLNRSEALALTRLPHRSTPQEITQHLLRIGPRIVGLTDGENGAYVATNGFLRFAPALTARFERVDATGAGDAFTAGFLAAYLAGREENAEEHLVLESALQAAIANSGSAVSAVGGQTGLLSLDDMKIDAHRVRIKEVG